MHYLSISKEASIDAIEDCKMRLSQKGHTFIYQNNKIGYRKDLIEKSDTTIIIPPHQKMKEANLKGVDYNTFLIGKGNHGEINQTTNKAYVFNKNKFYKVLQTVKLPKEKANWQVKYAIAFCESKETVI